MADGTETGGLPAVAEKTAVVAKGLKTINLPAGLENINPEEDITLPRVAIGQYTSDAVKKQRVKAGSLYNSLTEEVYLNTEGKVALDFIPIYYKKTRVMWKPGGASGVQHMSLDGIKSTKGEICASECPFETVKATLDREAITAYEWSTDEKGNARPPECQPQHVFLSLIAPFTSVIPVAIIFTSTSFTVGKKLNSMALMFGGPLFSRIYTLTTQEDKNDKGDFFIVRVTAKVKPSAEQFELAKAMYPWISGHEFKVDVGNEDGSKTDEIPF